MFVLQNELSNVQLKNQFHMYFIKNDGKKEEKCTFVIKKNKLIQVKSFFS